MHGYRGKALLSSPHARRSKGLGRSLIHSRGRLWGPAQPSPTMGQCLSGGLCWLEVERNRCKTRASLPLDAIRGARDGRETHQKRSSEVRKFLNHQKPAGHAGRF